MRQVQGKPLRKMYNMGFTMNRLLLHGYDSVRDPVLIPQDNYIEFQYFGFLFYFKMGKIFIAVLVIVLAVMVYIQQKSNYEEKEHEELGDFGLESKLDERLLLE
ncbi:hypothetical protein LguiA_019895 [Lonicera macranthoides]